MAQKLIETVARSTRLKALNFLKRTQGLSVSDLAQRLKMSYMGAKDICLDLEKHGLLSARREPKAAGTTGRPSLIYRLTEKATDLFPKASNTLTLELLDAVQRLQGYAAAEKLLMLTWQQRITRYTDKIKQSTLQERAAALTKMRDAEGHMAELTENENTLVIIEHHSPFADVMLAYPLVGRLEAELYRKVMGVPVERDEELNAGLQRVTYQIPLPRSGTAAPQPPKVAIGPKPVIPPKPVAAKPAPTPEPQKPVAPVQKQAPEPPSPKPEASPKPEVLPKPEPVVQKQTPVPPKPEPPTEATEATEAEKPDETPAKAKSKKTKAKKKDMHGYFDF